MVRDAAFSPYNEYLLALVYSSKIIKIDLRTLFEISASVSSVEQSSYCTIIDRALDSQQEQFISYCCNEDESSIILTDFTVDN